MLKIGLFCSASDDLDPKYYEESRKLGKWIGEHHHTIYYGGTHQGLMESTALSVKAAGGTVVGIMPQFMYDHQLASSAADKIIVTHDMVERKNMMMESSDIFIALPGGFGTWDEIFHVIACAQVGYHSKKMLLYNMDGFYNHLIEQAEEAYRQKFTPTIYRERLTAVNSLSECIKQLEIAEGEKLQNRETQTD